MLFLNNKAIKIGRYYQFFLKISKYYQILRRKGEIFIIIIIIYLYLLQKLSRILIRSI